MNRAFSNIIEDVKKLSVEEKEELRFLIERYLIEERREDISQNYRKSQNEHQENKLENFI